MKLLHAVASFAMAASLPAGAAEVPDAIAARGATIVLQAHAEGAQVYECKADASNTLIWQFREPIATLIVDGKTVGRHYAGPTWEIGGSTIVGKVVAKVPGTTDQDIPWLKLDIAEREGDGPLKAVTTVQRINTAGGNAQGGCERAGDFRSERYSAEYVFLKP